MLTVEELLSIFTSRNFNCYNAPMHMTTLIFPDYGIFHISLQFVGHDQMTEVAIIGWAMNWLAVLKEYDASKMVWSSTAQDALERLLRAHRDYDVSGE